VAKSIEEENQMSVSVYADDYVSSLRKQRNICLFIVGAIIAFAMSYSHSQLSLGLILAEKQAQLIALQNEKESLEAELIKRKQKEDNVVQYIRKINPKLSAQQGL
jgi:hypothetical protein